MKNAGLQQTYLDYLFVVLRLPANEIENAKKLVDTKDFQLEAISVLQYWRKTKGRAASKQAIIKALEECQYIEAVDILCGKWGLASEGKDMKAAN